jgi:mono/diheme cytochrome c family protein
MSAFRILRRGGWWLAAAAVVLPAALAQNRPASASSGAAVYQRYCVTCHGIQADGSGAAAKLFTPPPADLTRSTKSDEYKALIIRMGGQPMGRSPGMPPWGQELSSTQIDDVVLYLRTVAKVAQK